MKFNSLEDCNKFIRWCTPSIFQEVIDNYNPKIAGSVSISSLGKLQNNTGVFKKIHKLATKAYKNEGGHSHFCCEGSSGGVRVLCDFISKIMDSQKHVLATRNVHQSVVINMMKNSIPVRYIKTNFDKKLSIFIPPTVKDVIGEIKEDTGVVLISNPTYEGFSCDIKTIIKKIKEINKSIIIFVDEAWGSHFAFNDKLPVSSIEVGADIVVQSLHKQGGAPNPASIIHLSKRITKKYYNQFIKSYGENTSTTYSYPLVDAMDYTRNIMETEGKEKIDELIKHSDFFRKKVKNIKGIKVISLNTAFDYDKTKINLDVSGTGLSGDYIAKKLEEEYNIITEKEELTSLCFLTTFGIIHEDVVYTLYALRDIINNTPKKYKTKFKDYAFLPKTIEKKYENYEVEKMKKSKVLLKDSVDCILGENIKCYPPGIYIGQMGEVITKELKDYLLSQKGRAHVYADDESLEYVTVLKDIKMGL